MDFAKRQEPTHLIVVNATLMLMGMDDESMMLATTLTVNYALHGMKGPFCHL